MWVEMSRFSRALPVTPEQNTQSRTVAFEEFMKGSAVILHLDLAVLAGWSVTEMATTWQLTSSRRDGRTIIQTLPERQQ